MSQYLDSDSIRRTLSLLHEAGDVIEVRAFEATFRNNGQISKASTIAGYFNDRDKVIEELERLGYWKGISVNLNRLNPDCASRVTNQLSYLNRGDGTSDRDISRLRWLPIDIDVAIDGPVPASEDEHRMAVMQAHRIAAECGKLGWPQPIIGDSGNGVWLLFPVDLDPSEKDVVRRVIERAAKQFRADGLKVDASVGNPGRLVKLFGTMNRKGTEQEDRKHRLSRITSIGKQDVRLTFEKLAEFAPSAKRPVSRKSRKREQIDIAEFLATNNLSVGPPKDMGGEGTTWEFTHCPTCGEERKAFIQQFASGNVNASCLRDSCSFNWKDLLEKYAPPEAEAESELTGEEIFVDHEEHRVVAETLERLADHEEIYVRVGTLCTISKDHHEDKRCNIPQGTPTSIDLAHAKLRNIISARCSYMKLGRDDKPQLTHVPGFVVAQVAADGKWPGIRRLTYVTKRPLIRPDGSLLDQAGYDAVTGIVYDPCGDTYPAVPDNPTKDDAIAARDALLELVCDFPFAKEKADAYRAAWLAALLTLPADLLTEHARPPLILSNAGNASVGKSKVLEIIGEIALGGPLSTATFTLDHAEMRKVITSHAVKGVRAIYFDNVKRGTCIESPPLNAAITNTVWGDRMLGTNDAPEIPLQFMTLVSGNNLTTTTEVGRRTILIRLDAEDDHPELRDGFRIPNLVGHVRQHSHELYIHTLTILRAWHCAERPTSTLRAWGSFEKWSGVIRQAVVWLGLPDAMDGSLELTADGEDTTEVNIVLDAVQRALTVIAGEGVTAAELIKLAEAAGTSDASLAALVGLLPKPDSTKLGRKLAEYVNVRTDGRWLAKEKDRTNIWRYSVVDTRKSGHSG